MTSLDQRHVEPEILDHLEPDDPRAVASRRDLRLLNGLMGQVAIAAGLLRDHVPAPPRRLLEIGSGDGVFMLRVARRLHRRWPQVHVILLDRQDLVSHETRAAFEGLGWTVETVVADVFDWTAAASAPSQDVVAANLVLHHFSDDAIRLLFVRLAALTPILVATEPLRRPFALLASRSLRLVGTNAVTRHDAPVSVRAGFRAAELSALWPEAAAHGLIERRRGLFTHTFCAAMPTDGAARP
ncbi:methyltransferase domain-containing protein [Aureimonas pseudogalii]|uniref:Methyltransferase domain-containing protein n=1 Tax=Aureimonas pseudogalii TaxID=1744844 RepID=A0A7W6EG08_9HYPH|nr:methyltransferase domain-containing protein [Aureimonas pseudogalii]MBB3998025.1 hypothetical protein [Aureimonas pseudogalii]